MNSDSPFVLSYGYPELDLMAKARGNTLNTQLIPTYDAAPLLCCCASCFSSAAIRS